MMCSQCGEQINKEDICCVFCGALNLEYASKEFSKIVNDNLSPQEM